MTEELNALWIGVETYDAMKKEKFTLRVALMWTISDYPGFCNLPGWNTYIALSCPTYNYDVDNVKLTASGKTCFMESRRFLSRGHKFRLQKSKFNGKVEKQDPPKIFSCIDILGQVAELDVTFGKTQEKPARSTPQWKKKSILFKLPYWEFHLLHHNLERF